MKEHCGRTDEEAEMSLEGEAFNYDDILGHIGHMGKFQLRSYLPLCLPALFFGPVIMSYIFIGAIPKYRCHVEGCETATTSDFEPWWLNRTVPWNQPNQIERQCQRYNINWNTTTECQFEDVETDISGVTNCQRSVYDKSQFLSTIVTEFHLTCEDEWKQTQINTLFMAGMLIGAVTLGNLADIFGRKYTFMGIVLVLATSMTASAFAQNFATFAVLRFVSGIANIGYFLVLFVWGIEAVGQKYRVLCGFVYNMTTSVGSILVGVAAYYVRDWRTLQLITGAPIFLFLFVTMFLPESTRWLISKRRYPEARALILQAAEMNNKTIPHFLIEEKEVPIQTRSASTETIVNVFKSKILCKRIFILFGVWLVVTMAYYGITYSITNLAGDFYLNYGLSMAVELLSGLAGIYSMEKFGHRATLTGGLVFSGIACLITGVIADDPPVYRIFFSLVGKFFITCVMAVKYSYTIELFPTSTRNSVIGLCSTVDNIGGMMAPSLADIGRMVDQSVPYIIFAVANIVIGLFCLMLPETSQSQLPTTIIEAEDIERYTLTREDFKFLKIKLWFNPKKAPANEPEN